MITELEIKNKIFPEKGFHKVILINVIRPKHRVPIEQTRFRE